MLHITKIKINIAVYRLIVYYALNFVKLSTLLIKKGSHERYIYIYIYMRGKIYINIYKYI